MTSAVGWLQRHGFGAEGWNLVVGCSKRSAGCMHCYAERMAHRWGWTRFPWTESHERENVTLHPERLKLPGTWTEPRMVFVNVFSDLYHERVPHEFLAQAYQVMRDTPQHIYIILTKRPENIWIDGRWPKNIWLGVTVEDQRAKERLPILAKYPVAVKLVSCEPLLEPLGDLELARWGIGWGIAGGESGPKARPMQMAWARDVRDQCVKAGAAFYFKQSGGLQPGTGDQLIEEDGSRWFWKQWPGQRDAPVQVYDPPKNGGIVPSETADQAPNHLTQMSIFDLLSDGPGDVADLGGYLDRVAHGPRT